MSAHVEARSLAELNFLAANPPQYPVNPTEEPQDALTLYISRVPGTRDIILSTFKPQIKNVTAEDVANSLYYVHLELPADLTAPHPLRSQDSPRSSLDSSHSRNPIRRKPLPTAAAKLSAPPLSPDDAQYRPEYRPEPLAQRPLGGENQSPEWPGDDERKYRNVTPALPPRPIAQSSAAPSMPHRKPLGPRPMGDTPEKHLPSLPAETAREALSPRSMEQPRPAMPQVRVGAGSRSPSPSKRTNPGSVPFALTLIRRDPSSGHQWNIGRVASYQLEDPAEGYFGDETHASHSHEHASNGHKPPINIRLETSGYAKFRGMRRHPNLETPLGTSSTSLSQSPTGHGMGGFEDAAAARLEGGFLRQVVMAYRKSWATNIREKMRSNSDELIPVPTGLKGHTRQESANSNGSMESSGSGGDPNPSPVYTQPGHGLRPKGYIFTSPWDGRCEFRTGNAGRSVKCRHVLQNSTSAYNPLVPSSHGRHGSAWSGSASVSELRFNLPSNEILKSRSDEGKVHQLHGHFSKLLKLGRDGDHSDDDGPVSPFDIELGKEKAGGGNRGKRAKLGKLIIHPEGLKMLDLIVAANIGVWWGAWEKSF